MLEQSAARKRRIHDLAKSVSASEIARRHGISRQRVYKILGEPRP